MADLSQARIDSLAGHGIWQYMVDGECHGEYLISESEDKCAFVGTTNNCNSIHFGLGVKHGRSKYEFISTVLTTPHTAPVVSVIVAERMGSELIQISGLGPNVSEGEKSEESKDRRWVVSGYPYTLSLVTRIFSTMASVLKNSQYYGDLSGVWEWRDNEVGTVPVHYMLIHIPHTSVFASPFKQATEHVVDMVWQLVVNVADGWSEIGVAKFYRSGEGRKKGILRGRVDMVRASMSEQGHSTKSYRFTPRLLYVDGNEIKDHEDRRVWLKASPSPAPQSAGRFTLNECQDPLSFPEVSSQDTVVIKGMMERLIPSFFNMLKACDTSRARKFLSEMEQDERTKFLCTPGPQGTEFQTYPPIILAARWCSPELAKFLVAQGADVRQTLMMEGRLTNALHHAIAIADSENQGWQLVKYFIEKCRVEVDVLAFEWAHTRVRGGSSKPKTPEEIAYLWTRVPNKRRKELMAAVAAVVPNPILSTHVPASAPVAAPAPVAFRPEIRIVSPVTVAAPVQAAAPQAPKVEKSRSDNWRRQEKPEVRAPAPTPVAAPAPAPVAAPAPAPVAAPVVAPAAPVAEKRYVPPALRAKAAAAAAAAAAPAVPTVSVSLQKIVKASALKAGKKPVAVAASPVLQGQVVKAASSMAGKTVKSSPLLTAWTSERSRTKSASTTANPLATAPSPIISAVAPSRLTEERVSWSRMGGC